MCVPSLYVLAWDAGTDAAVQAPDRGPTSEGLLSDLRRRANDIAAAVSKLLNTASVRLDDVRVHVSLQAATQATPQLDPASTAASVGASARGKPTRASSSSANSTDGVAQPTGEHADPGACVALYIDCVRAVDSTDWVGASVPAEDGRAQLTQPHCEKTVLWEGLTVRICEHCVCPAPSSTAQPRAAAEAASSDAASTSDDASTGPDEDGDCFFAASEEPRAPRAGTGRDHERPGVLVLTGTGGAGFGGRLVLALRWAAQERGGALQRVHLDVSSAAGALVPLHADSLALVLRVAAA